MIATRPAAPWRQLAWAAVAASGVLLAAELLLHAVIRYPPPLREVDDAVADLRTMDPTVLVIGSSHARSFDSIGAELSRRTGGRELMLSVPVEYGKLASYLWVYRHRLEPLLDQAGPDGAPWRRRLRNAIIVTEWWDSCEPDNGPVSVNLPARAWTFRDFLADVREHGFNDFNRNYVANRWRRLWHASLLVQDRGVGIIGQAIRERIRPPDSLQRARQDERQVSQWRGTVERGASCLGATPQMRALDSLVEGLQARPGVRVTVLLYPRKPNTLTDQARATTLRRFSSLAAQQAMAHGAGFVDMTEGTPLQDTDFAADFDHVTPGGNRRLASWALDGPLAWLAGSADSPAPPSPGGTL